MTVGTPPSLTGLLSETKVNTTPKIVQKEKR